MEKKDWFKDRGYPHFSNKTPLSARNKVKTYLASSSNIATHSFYPLIFKEIIQRRYKMSNFENVEKRSHKTFKNGKVTSNKKIREILYASHLDAHIYSFYNQKLSKKYEEYLTNNSKTSDSISAYRQVETDQA